MLQIHHLVYLNQSKFSMFSYLFSSQTFSLTSVPTCSFPKDFQENGTQFKMEIKNRQRDK